MTSAMDLPLHGKVKLYETSKKELLTLWKEVLKKNSIEIVENTKVEAIVPENNHFLVKTLNGKQFSTQSVLLSIGRRGTPRKLGIEGEMLEKVAYRLLEPEHISGQDVLVVGGGDSAIESALLLTDENRVTLTYRSEVFSRIKPKNDERINQAISEGKIKVMFNTNPTKILEDSVVLSTTGQSQEQTIKNDLVYIFAGGELPTQFLQKIGILITKKFGEAILSHK